MDIFPGVKTVCNTGFKTRDEFCKFDLYELLAMGIVNNETITPKNVGDILQKYGVGYQAKKIWDSIQDSRWETLPNLGVQTNIVFVSVIPTKKFFNFSGDPRGATAAGKVVTPTFTYTYGDSSVNTASALIPGIKWAQDFKDGVSGAKPINFIEMCGDYQKRTSVFEGSTNKVTKSSYFGMGCACKGSSLFKSDGSGCDHVKMVSDA
jgi:hypothetical protein